MRPSGMYGPTSVLLVENDSMDAQRITQQLSTPPPDTLPGVTFAVDYCHHLESGLVRLAQGGIDVVILELTPSGASDFMALRKIRGGHEDIPVVVLSRRGDEALGLRAVREGAQDYLVQGHSTPDHLQQVLLTAIERQRLHVALVQARRTEQVLRERREEQAVALTESMAELRLFTHIVSSSFRIPLDSLAAHSRQLHRLYHGKGDGLTDTLTDNLLHGVERMQLFIQGMSDYLSIDAADRPFTVCNSNQLFDRAQARLQAVIQSTKAVVTCDALPSVRGDAEQLAALFTYLLDNALEFHQTHEPPRVHCYYETWGPEGAFAVRDEGLGIETANLNSIFRLFHRAHMDSSKPGVGSGLAICRRIVERHGGRLWVESEPHQGTTFYFTLRC